MRGATLSLPAVMIKLLCIAFGGAAGAVLRYAVSGVALRWGGTNFPWGTLAVNLIGSFLIGVLVALFDAVAVSPNVRAMLLIGLLGAFTTFSTFSLESVNLLRDGQYALAAVNVGVSCLAGLALVFVGLVACRVVLSALR